MAGVAPRKGGGQGAATSAPRRQPPTAPAPSSSSTSFTNSSHRLHLRLIDSSKKTPREDVYATTFGKLQAPLTRLHDCPTGFYALTDDIRNVDKLLTETAIQELAKINLKPMTPPDIRARRSIFIRQVDSTVGQKTADDIKTEIQRLQPDVKVHEIIKIKDYTHIFKIILRDNDSTQRLLTNGLNLFNTRISPTQMTQDTYTHLLICYKCYKFETHATKDCPETRLLCSECGQTGHTYRDCDVNDKNCLNCRQAHRTLAAKCPYRKQTIDNKQQRQTTEQTNRQNQTYVQIARQALDQDRPDATPITLTNKTNLKLTALILEAHIASLPYPNKFRQILSKSLKDNFDIDATFPDRDSRKIFNLYFHGQETQQEDDDIPPTLPDIEMTEATDKRRRTSSQDDTTTPATKTYKKQTKATIQTSQDVTSPNRFRALEDNQMDEPETRYDWTLTKTQRQRKHSKNRQSPPKQKTPTKQRDLPTVLNDQPLIDNLPDLNATWRPTTLMANLPPPQPQRQRQRSNERPKTIQPEQLGLQLLRNENDPSPIPPTLDKTYLRQQLRNTDNTTGLKVIMTTDEDPDIILNLLTEGLIPVTSKHLLIAPHDNFIKFPRLSKRPSKK